MPDPCLKCNPDLYHYNGYCFNKGRVPEGQIAIPAKVCESMQQRQEATVTVIR